MGFFSTEFLAKRRVQWMESIKTFQYQIGGAWYDATINSKAIEGNTIKFLVAIPNTTGSANTITGVRIIDKGGALAGSQSLNIQRSASQSVLMQFQFPIQEV